MIADLASRLSSVPLFKGEDITAIAKMLADIPLTEYSAGDYLCKEGEYDENCLILLEGEAEVTIGGAEGPRSFSNRLKPGALFGEIAALSGNPRTADIIACDPVLAMAIPRKNIFKLFDSFPGIKQRIDDLYRKRALATHLLTIPIFSGATKSFIESLAREVSLLTFQKDDLIFKQGEVADAFYLIRYGFVKVHQTHEGKERALAYLKEGSFFGEVALIREGETRTASITAINRVEVVRLSVDNFRAMIDEHPVVLRNLTRIIKRREERNRQLSADSHLADTMRLTIESGVIQTKAILIMDTTRCVHCDNCVKACAALHQGTSLLVRSGVRFNNFTLIPTSCRHCEDPTCMSDCPTGAITRDAHGEIYHKDFCIGCGGCARNCPYGNITIVDRASAKTNRGVAAFIASMFSSRKNGDEKTDGAKGTGAGFVFPGDRDQVERPPEKRFAGDRDMVVRKKPDGNGKKVGKKAAKCDMCREYEYMGCVYHCPTGAAQRVDPTKFFGEMASIG